MDTFRYLNEFYLRKLGCSIIASKENLRKLFTYALRVETGILRCTDIIKKDSTVPNFIIRSGDADSDEINRIRLMQYALLCRGYSINITGKMDRKTIKAIRDFKKDVLGVSVSDVTISPIWFEAILNSNSYILDKNGNPNIWKIQQYMNRKYGNYCGIISCDGHYSAQMNLGLVRALQYELKCEKIDGRFGDDTLRLCNTISPGMCGRLVCLLQSALYVNDFRCKIDGIYSSKLVNCVKAFQIFMRLKVTGVADTSTIKALLSSSGDQSRPAVACDCCTQLTPSMANILYDHGYRYVGRYLSGYIIGYKKKHIPKYLTKEELSIIKKAGLRVFLIYQELGNKIDYFNEKQGIEDARTAVKRAYSLHIPKGATIYFAVDCDPSEDQIRKLVIPYFRGIYRVIRGSRCGYLIGVYGSRCTCSIISDAGYAKSSFVNGLADHYNGNTGYKLPKNWAFDQFCELKGKEKLKSKDGSFALDKDAFSGRDIGIVVAE